jgi:hypothetical protein
VDDHQSTYFTKFKNKTMFIKLPPNIKKIDIESIQSYMAKWTFEIITN